MHVLAAAFTCYTNYPRAWKWRSESITSDGNMELTQDLLERITHFSFTQTSCHGFCKSTTINLRLARGRSLGGAKMDDAWSVEQMSISDFFSCNYESRTLGSKSGAYYALLSKISLTRTSGSICVGFETILLYMYPPTVASVYDRRTLRTCKLTIHHVLAHVADARSTLSGQEFTALHSIR